MAKTIVEGGNPERKDDWGKKKWKIWFLEIKWFQNKEFERRREKKDPFVRIK